MKYPHVWTWVQKDVIKVQQTAYIVLKQKILVLRLKFDGIEFFETSIQIPSTDAEECYYSPGQVVGGTMVHSSLWSVYTPPPPPPLAASYSIINNLIYLFYLSRLWLSSDLSRLQLSYRMILSYQNIDILISY